MQPTNRSSRILLPVKLWFVYFSFIVALFLDYIPTGGLPGVPTWVALVLAFWCLREPLHVGMGTAFCLGVLMDIGKSVAMGQHALAYVVIAYCVTTLSRRLMWFRPTQQALHLLPILLLGQVLMLLVRMLAGDEFPGWSYFLSSFTTVLLWPLVSIVLLIPQYQPIDQDENRPI